jgi:hypothetical protein
MGIIRISCRVGGLVAAVAVVATAGPVGSASATTITGTAQQGQTLTADPGLPLSGVTFQWEDCDASGANCVPIPGATSQTYTLTAGDVGKTIVAEVWGGPPGPVASDPTSVVLSAGPVNTSPPAVSVFAVPFTATPGTWTGDPTSYAYQWMVCDPSATNFIDPGPITPGWLNPACTAIAGATATTYTATPAQAGSGFAVEVWATNALGTNGPVQSPVERDFPEVGVPPTYTPTLPTPAPPTFSSTSALPSINGATTVGTELTASTGSWTAAAGLSITYGYQWERCNSSTCSAIAGATGSTYTPTSADIGDKLEVLINAVDRYGSNSEASAEVGPITEPPFSTASMKRLARSLDGAIAPRGRRTTIGRLLRAGGFAAAISAMPPGRLTLSWTAMVPGRSRTIQLGRASVEVPDSGDATLRLVLSRAARAFLRKAPALRVRARATLLVAGELPIDGTATFMLPR